MMSLAGRWIVLALVLVVAAPVAATAQGAAPVGPRFLVVPFDHDAAEPRLHWMGEASAVILTDDLLALGAQAVTRDDRLRAFDVLRLPDAATLSHATLIRVGQIVGAQHIVLGRVAMKGDILSVTLRTIRVDAGRLSPEVSEQGPLDDLFVVYARLSRRLVPDSAVTLQAMEQDHPSPAAFEQYIKGLLAESPETKISYLTEARRLAPSFGRPRLALWRVHHDASEYRRALDAVRDVPPGHRVYRRARFLTGVSMLYLGQLPESFAVFDELQRARPDPALLNNLGVVQLRRPLGSEGGRAVTFFAEAVKLDPADADLAFNLGYAYWRERELTSAATWLREAVRNNPADAEAHFVLAVSLHGAWSTAEAARERELAVRLSADLAEFAATAPDPTSVPRSLERVKLEVDVPAWARVQNAIVAAGQRDQRDLAAFHLGNGRRLFEASRDTEAIAELRRAVYLAPYSGEAHLLLGRLYLRGSRYQEAVDALNIAVWSDDTVPARLALAEAYIGIKDDARARAELQIVLGRDPNNAEAARLLDELPEP